MSDLAPPPPPPTLFTAEVRDLQLRRVLVMTKVVEYTFGDGLVFLRDIENNSLAIPASRGLIVELKPES